MPSVDACASTLARCPSWLPPRDSNFPRSLKRCSSPRPRWLSRQSQTSKLGTRVENRGTRRARRRPDATRKNIGAAPGFAGAVPPLCCLVAAPLLPSLLLPSRGCAPCTTSRAAAGCNERSLFFSSFRPPASDCRAAALGVSGAVFLGVNLEFPGLPLSQSVHAEQFAVCNATLAGERGISTIAVNEAPCGHCRQFMCELPSAGELTVAGGNRPTHTLAELLPDRFGPEALLHDDGSHRIMTNDPVELRLTADSSAELEALRGESQGPLAAVAEAALAQAKRSYTPYTNSQAGLSLGIPAAGDDPVLVVAGAALESAAYNPTLPPFQAAAIALRVAGGWDRLKDVAECVLVERRDAPTSHAAITRAAIETVAPKARFTHLWAEV